MPIKLNNLFAKTILPIIGVFAVGIFALIFFISQINKQNAIETATINAKSTIHQYRTLRSYYTKNVVKKVMSKSNLRVTFDHKIRENAIPLPATLIQDLSSLLADSEGMRLMLYSAFPFPNREDRVLDDFAKEAIAYFKTNPDGTFVKTDLIKGNETVRVAIADKMVDESCVTCHNTHPLTPKKGWKLGDVRGVLEVIIPINQQISANRDVSFVMSYIVGLMFIIIVASILFLFRRSITNPIKKLSNMSLQVADGKLDTKIDIKSRDEIGSLADSFNWMTQNLQKTTVSKDYVDNIIKSMLDTLIVLDLDLTIKSANQAALKLLGYSEDELIGKSARIIFTEESSTMSVINDLITKNINSIENTYRSKDNRKIPVLFSSSLMRNDKGNVQGIICVALDITERKKAEEEIKRKNEELKDTNEEIQAQSEELETSNTELCAQNETIVETNMNLEKSYGDLKDAYKKISKLEEVKTNFVSTVSHELRTPLTSILGFATTTLNYYENDILPLVPMVDKKVKRRANRIKQNLSIVVSEGERLTRLINDVLDIAKMEAGKTEWNIKEIDIIAICRQALSAVSGYPKSDRVETRFEAPDNVRSVKGDPDRLVQVIANFMSNALKFTEQGIVTLSVEPGEEDVKVMVSDTGKGISKDGLGKVFEKFTQMEDEIEEGKPKGTGLGLPICKEIIEHLDGSIWVESEVGKGSRFCFTINYYAVEKEKPADSITRVRKRVIEEVRQKATINTEIDTENKMPNVLVVDDDPNIRELLRQELELERYNVLEAKDGVEALKIVKNRDNHVDLILLDIMMPDIDGFDVLSSIKANEKLAHIPVIVISAYDYKQKMYLLGAEGFIIKPIDQTQLLSDMSALLNGVSGKKALLIDSDDNIEDIRPFLKEKGYIVDSASNGEEGLKKARDERPDIIMLGLEMPDIKKGLETIKKLHKSKNHIHMILFGRRMNKVARKIAETMNVEIIELNDMQKLLER
ncbi:MAG: response regulator [Candidatus Anammoxibacter sp.]